MIVVHDCSPTSEVTASPIKGPTPKIWNGNVWKTTAHLRLTRSDLNVFTLDCVFGLGVVTDAAAQSMLRCSLREINSLTYEDLDADRERILNLKPATYLSDFLPASGDLRLPPAK